MTKLCNGRDPAIQDASGSSPRARAAAGAAMGACGHRSRATSIASLLLIDPAPPARAAGTWFCDQPRARRCAARDPFATIRRSGSNGRTIFFIDGAKLAGLLLERHHAAAGASPASSALASIAPHTRQIRSIRRPTSRASGRHYRAGRSVRGAGDGDGAAARRLDERAGLFGDPRRLAGARRRYWRTGKGRAAGSRPSRGSSKPSTKRGV